MRLSLIVFGLCLLAGCAGGPRAVLGEDTDTVRVEPVSNHAGVSLRVPEMYMADMLGASDALEVEHFDLALITRAALIAGLRVQDVRTAETGATHTLAAAITQYDAVDLRRTGRFRMTLLLILVNSATGGEIARAETGREFELFSKPPGEQGALGDQRFIRRKMEGFTEALAREALRELGLR